MLAAPPKMLLIEGPKNKSDSQSLKGEDDFVEVSPEGRTPNNPFEILLGKNKFSSS
jgi:hypothetical protein